MPAWLANSWLMTYRISISKALPTQPSSRPSQSPTPQLLPKRITNLDAPIAEQRSGLDDESLHRGGAPSRMS